MSDEPRAALVAALAATRTPNERQLAAVAVIQAAFAREGLDLVLVGGAAIAAWDANAAPSLDVDLVGWATRDELDRVFAGLGLRREHGRHWVDETIGLAVEVPATRLVPVGAAVGEITRSDGSTVRVIDVVDLLCDRVEAWIATGDLAAYEQAAVLDRHPAVDRVRLAARIHALRLEDAARAVRLLRAAGLDGGVTITPALSHAVQAATTRGDIAAVPSIIAAQADA